MSAPVTDAEHGDDATRVMRVIFDELATVYEAQRGLAYGELERILEQLPGGLPLTYEQGRYDEQMAIGPDRTLLELWQRNATMETELAELREALRVTNLKRKLGSKP